MHERLSIGAFADRCGLSVSALRFYADRGLLLPASVDPSSGYRFYEEGQLEAAVLIRELRLLGLPLAEVAGFLEASAPERRSVIDARVAELERQLDHARAVACAIHTRLDRSETPMTDTTTVGGRELRAAIDQVLPALGTDPKRPQLLGALVESRLGSLRLVATDSYRMVIRDIPVHGSAIALRAVVTGDDLRSWSAALGQAGEATLAVDDDEIVFRSAAGELRGRRLPVEFPAYEEVLTAHTSGETVVVDRERLLVALDRFAEQGDAVLLDVVGDVLAVIRRDERVEVGVRHGGMPCAVALDPRFVADSVRAAVGPEVVLEIGSPLHPVVIRSADDGTYTALLMPVRLA